MRIAVGSDHRGVHLREKILEFLHSMGIETVDVGTRHVDPPVDYPDVAAEVAGKVARGEADRGILICGTGLGMAIVANKFSGIRAAPCHDLLTAEISRRHNDTNILCLSGDMLGDRLVDALVEVWIKTEFEGGRHARRLEKIRRLEHCNGYAGAPVQQSADRKPAS